MSSSGAVQTKEELVVDTPPQVEEPAGRSIWQWLAIPIAVALIVGGVVLYLATADLDFISRQQLSTRALLQRTWEHIVLTGISTAAVLVIALPLGILVTRRWARSAAPLVVGLANVGQAAPSVGLIVLVALWYRLGPTSAIIALTAYAVLPVLRNTITGLRGVDPHLIEAGRGMGMSSTAVLFRIELPLAVPVILAGIRTALVLLVGTAALAAFIDGGGLGDPITIGIKLNRTPPLVVGAVLVAALALIVDWLGRVVEEVARPRGL